VTDHGWTTGSIEDVPPELYESASGMSAMRHEYDAGCVNDRVIDGQYEGTTRVLLYIDGLKAEVVIFLGRDRDVTGWGWRHFDDNA
jgi:hypothetical protein